MDCGMRRMIFQDRKIRAQGTKTIDKKIFIRNCSGLSQRKIVENRSVPTDLVGITELGWRKDHAKQGQKKPRNCVG